MNNLIGSDKQVSWATTIRDKKINDLDILIKNLQDKMTPASIEKSVQIINHIKNITDAGTWIAMKDQPMTSVNWIVDLYKQYKKTGEISIIGQRHDIYVIADKNTFNF